MEMCARQVWRQQSCEERDLNSSGKKVHYSVWVIWCDVFGAFCECDTSKVRSQNSIRKYSSFDWWSLLKPIEILLRELNTYTLVRSRTQRWIIHKHATHVESVSIVLRIWRQSFIRCSAFIFLYFCCFCSYFIHMWYVPMAMMQCTNAWKTDDENKINKLQSQQKI